MFKKILPIIISFFIIYTPYFAFAATRPSAKPTIWQIVYATPKKTNILDDVVDATNLNDVVEATGRKLDYDRTPVDNKVYKARVNPRIPETKKAIGSTAMKKLLKVSGYGYLATEALNQLLKGIDWVIDPEAQSIWRYKRTDNNDGVTCSYTQTYQGKVYSVVYKDSYGDFHSCPLEAAKHRIEYHEETQFRQVEKGSGRFLRWDTTDFSQGVQYFYADYIVKEGLQNAGQRTPELRQSVNAVRDKEIIGEKEILTDDALADYMLGTHKDFQDQKYKDKLPKPNTWTGVAQVFKPENRFEEENSPTVKIAQHELDQSLPESEDTTVKPTEPDPNTGEKGFTLPAFCSWASAVCEHFKWVKDDTGLPARDESDLEIDQPFEEKNIGLNVSPQCPAPTFQTITLHGVTAQVKTSDYTYICQLDWLIKPFTIGFATVLACFILFGFHRGSED
ncbi:virulence factor TspB C-terminal domain-related protein [Acinetobacter haemolyticus]|uniref:virulence factor TspB C-terminal domain-related protein n=1 Tax=Acinetobacter haemolyticus TaxID=29430 RepID=UPI001D198423|nr:virulence factor TspB C-terminal domain-related protein [Acinetobacter haemolyticus]